MLSKMLKQKSVKFFTICAMAVSMALFATACQSTATQGNKQTIGTLGGAVVGGVLGSNVGKGSGQMWAIGAGTLLGALVGNEIGSSLDRADIAYANQAESRAHTARMGETINWNNPETGNRGTVTPVRDGYADNGRYCREYQQTINVGGKQETGYGTACRQPDGSWEIIS